MDDKEIYNLLDDLLMSYQIVANDKDKMKLSRYYKTLNDFIIEYKTLQSNWNSLREWLEQEIDKNERWFKEQLSEHDKKYYKETYNVAGFILNKVLDKMNELEGKDRNEISSIRT